MFYKKVERNSYCLEITSVYFIMRECREYWKVRNFKWFVRVAKAQIINKISTLKQSIWNITFFFHGHTRQCVCSNLYSISYCFIYPSLSQET